MSQKLRVGFPDSIKGLAVLLMIQVHLMELFATQELYESFWGKISLFLGGIPAAPIFMVFMGYFLAFSRKNPSAMALRGIRLFLGGLLLNIGLNLHLLYNIFFEKWELNPFNSIFGADILTLAGLSLLSFAIVQKVSKNSYLIYFFLALLIALVSQFFTPYQFEDHPLHYVLSFIIGGTSWSFFPLIPWLSYPLLGFGFKLMNDKFDFVEIVKKSWTKYLIGILILILAVSIKFGINITNNLPEYYHFDFMFFLWSLAFILVWIYIFYFIERKLQKTHFFSFLKFLGKNVTVVYVFQWLIIGNLATTFYKSKNLVECAIWFLLILMVSSILTNFWSKVSYLRYKKNHFQANELK